MEQRLINKQFLAKPLLKRNLNRFDGTQVRYYRNSVTGFIKGELRQLGTNFRVTVKWNNGLLSEEWLTCLISLDAKVNFQLWRQQLINRM